MTYAGLVHCHVFLCKGLSSIIDESCSWFQAPNLPGRSVDFLSSNPDQVRQALEDRSIAHEVVVKSYEDIMLRSALDSHQEQQHRIRKKREAPEAENEIDYTKYPR